jgi:hypothetical protein
MPRRTHCSKFGTMPRIILLPGGAIYPNCPEKTK